MAAQYYAELGFGYSDSSVTKLTFGPFKAAKANNLKSNIASFNQNFSSDTAKYFCNSSGSPMLTTAPIVEAAVVVKNITDYDLSEEILAAAEGSDT